MIKYNGMKSEENIGVVRNLPAGPYVCQVLDARVEGMEPDQRLAIMFEVYEGDFAGFYTKKYREAKERGSNYEIKYKGVIRLRIPNPDNKKAQYPESDIRRFNDMIWRFEQSNDGFVWDGDETKLKGKLIGVSVQEDEYNGATFTKPVRFEVVSDVRNGLVKVMRPKGEQENPTIPPVIDPMSGMEQVQTEKLPWD